MRSLHVEQNESGWNPLKCIDVLRSTLTGIKERYGNVLHKHYKEIITIYMFDKYLLCLKLRKTNEIVYVFTVLYFAMCLIN